MSRTADRVREQGIVPPWWASAGMDPDILRHMNSYATNVRDLLLNDADRVPVIETSNVASMIFNLNKPLGLYDFPCLAPPWGFYWMEYQHISVDAERWRIETNKLEDRMVRSGMPSEVKAQLALMKIQRVAALFISMEPEEWPTRTFQGLPELDEPETKWVIRVMLFIEADRVVTGPQAMYHLFLDEHGRTLDFQWLIPKAKGISEEDCVQGKDGFTMLLAPMLYGTSLLHCKNIRTEHVSVPTKVQLNRRRKNKPPLVRYQMVKVEPFTAKTRRVSDGPAVGPGEGPAFHIVPGHFGHYGDCCPGVHEPHGLLFGKLTGMYWMPMHARGNPVRGRVDSDYVIETQERTSA